MLAFPMAECEITRTEATVNIILSADSWKKDSERVLNVDYVITLSRDLREMSREESEQMFASAI